MAATTSSGASSASRPLAHALVAMADEAALYVVAAKDRAMARGEMTQVLERLTLGLIKPGTGSGGGAVGGS